MIIALALSFAVPEAPPPPPTLFHHRAPNSRVVTTRYQCDDGSRSFAVRYRLHAFQRVESGVRKGRRLTGVALERATAALRRLDGFETIIPECSPDSDSLMVVGRVGRQRMVVYLRWTASGIEATAPEAIGF